jgi:unsaturated rhamnogalacturonyl hydrolase
MAALALYTETCELGYREVVSDTLTFLYDEALRDADGGINHLGTSPIFGVSLWLDSLFMFGGVLSRWGNHADDARALDEYAGQFALFARRLQHDGGFLMHAHNWPVSTQDDDIFWARGNAWITASGYEYLTFRKKRGESDANVEQALAKQVDAIVASQEPADGLWWTVLNRPGETYTETSASALFALGLARGHRAGFVDAAALPVIQSAMAGVRSRIVDATDGPMVTGISGPTTVGDFDHYAAIEVEGDIHYGVGAVILALIETSGL